MVTIDELTACIAETQYRITQLEQAKPTTSDVYSIAKRTIEHAAMSDREYANARYNECKTETKRLNDLLDQRNTLRNLEMRLKLKLYPELSNWLKTVVKLADKMIKLSLESSDYISSDIVICQNMQRYETPSFVTWATYIAKLDDYDNIELVHWALTSHGYQFISDRSATNWRVYRVRKYYAK